MFGLVPYKGKNQGLVGSSIWDMERMMDDFFKDSFFSNLNYSGNLIKADIKETENNYLIEAELPGFEKDQIELELKDDVLTISVEQNKEDSVEKENYIMKERRYGSFKRSFHVENVKNEDVNAEYKNGVLRISLPKNDNPPTKKYNIQIQ